MPKNKPPRKKAGYPKKRDKISKEIFEELCAAQCTLMEVCAFFEMDDKTINTWVKENYDGRTFSEVFVEKRLVGFSSLRRRTFEEGMSGNTAVMIFLNKVWLGLNEKVEVQVDKKDDIIIDMTSFEDED